MQKKKKNFSRIDFIYDIPSFSSITSSPKDIKLSFKVPGHRVQNY